MIDREKLKSLLGDESMVDRMIDIFQSETPGQLSELSQAIEAGDWSNASILAHTIKSQVAYLGLDYAVSLAREIEHKADQEKDLNSLAGLADALDSELQPFL
ncbi:MAG: Hpt domain-containing protein [Saprospiraceae bacterium]|nr:Hpt domain-containing protein [Saprospiraceae bacterium]